MDLEGATFLMLLVRVNTGFIIYILVNTFQSEHFPFLALVIEHSA